MSKSTKIVIAIVGVIVLLKLARGKAGAAGPSLDPPPPPKVKGGQTESSSGTQTLKHKTGGTKASVPRPGKIAPSGLAARLQALGPNLGCPPGRQRIVHKIGTKTTFMCV